MLSWVVKESMRLTPPVVASIDYRAVKPGAKLCGVEIPHEASIFAVIGPAQNDPRQWQQPNKFLPERYNPSSSLFKKPDGGNRHPLSHIPFTFGLRNCPGQVLGLLESKICVAYVALKMAFELDQEPELRGRRNIVYTLANEFKLHVRVKSLST